MPLVRAPAAATVIGPVPPLRERQRCRDRNGELPSRRRGRRLQYPAEPLLNIDNKEKRMPQTDAKPDEFTLDRERLTVKMLEDYGEPVGIDSFGESDPERIAEATRYATYGGAVACPAEITM